MLATFCPNMHATGVGCPVLNTCDYATCDPGYYDCDGVRANGCEIATPCAEVLVSGAGAATGLAVESGNVYWTDRARGEVWWLPPDAGTSRFIASGQGAPTGIALFGDSIYWANESTNRIATLQRDGGGGGTVLGTPSPRFIAVDAVTQYWTSGSGTVSRNFLSMSNPLVTGLGSPWALVIDADALYWTDNSDAGAFGRTDFASATTTRYASGTPFTGIAIDGARVYASKFAGNEIVKVPIDGGALLRVVTTPSPGSLVYSSGFLYWANGTQIRRVSVDGGAQDVLAGTSSATPVLAIDGRYVYWTDGARILRTLK